MLSSRLEVEEYEYMTPEASAEIMGKLYIWKSENVYMVLIKNETQVNTIAIVIKTETQVAVHRAVVNQVEVQVTMINKNL